MQDPVMKHTSRQTHHWVQYLIRGGKFLFISNVNAMSLRSGSSTYLLYEVNASLYESKVYKGPLNALPFVLLLLQDEHVVVEILLQFLIGEVEA